MKKTKLLFIFFLPATWAQQASTSCQTVSITNSTTQPERVYNYISDHCSNQLSDFADNPVRPFIVNRRGILTVMWFASNSYGYFQTIGIPVGENVSDILAKMQRVIDPQTKQCIPWLESNPFENSVPDNYHSRIWMAVPYTTNGEQVYALIHNEFHGEETNNPQYCSGYGPSYLAKCWYANLIGAASQDGATSFQFYRDPATNNNAPVIASPYVYVKDIGRQGMEAQSNIIHWGNYYYILVGRQLNNNGHLPPGVCLYRTNNISDLKSWQGWNGNTHQYDIHTVENYPTDVSDPAKYTCTPVIPEVPQLYHFSWSYNTVLHQFIILGVDTHFVLPNKQIIEAFVYTTATIDSASGIFNWSRKEYFLKQIHWTDEWKNSKVGDNITGQSYPSLLDPTSPIISDSSIPNKVPGDLNFQYSAQMPYLYYTRLNPKTQQNQGNNRDVVREQLTVQNCPSPNVNKR